jgi:hypothetical protein
MTGAIHRTLPTFAEARKKRASIIGATCVFGTKIYKNVGCIFTISACGERNKKIFQISDFCSALPAFLVEKFPKNMKHVPQISQILEWIPDFCILRKSRQGRPTVESQGLNSGPSHFSHFYSCSRRRRHL